MVSSRKRGHQEMEAAEPPREPSLIERIRNMWEFANLAQWIFIFGKAVKIDEKLDIEELEMECLKTQSTVLVDIGLAILKFVSSHRGLTPEIFDDYTRRQYIAKAPDRNPFGDEEEPAKFTEFDIFTKIKVLQQLTQWTMMNPDRIRERMEEQKDSDQTFWRVEPFGWDSDDRTYFVLDDNRLYRRTEPPPPPPPARPQKKNTKKAKAALRASKRRKVSEPLSEEENENGEEENGHTASTEEDNGLGGAKWECIAITLDELNDFLKTLLKTRDANEKILRQRLTEDLLPILEKQEESRKRKAAQQEKELLNLERLANAKRSSRIASKVEHQRHEEEAREAERKKQAELSMAKKEQERWLKLEKERESRMMTREQRLKEREARRILHEAELAGLSEDSKKLETGESRISERHLKAEIEKKKQALEELAEEDDDWVFDCICGAYGQVDDGTLSIACEKCNIWQHTKCVGVSDEDAARDDFHFVCKTCIRRAQEAERAKREAERAAERAKKEEAERARKEAERKRRAEQRAKEAAEEAKNRPTIKIKLNRPGSSSSPAPSPGLPSPSLNGSMAQPRPGDFQGNLASPKKPILHHYSHSPPTNGAPYQNGQSRPQPHYSQSPNGLPSPVYQNYRPSSQGAPSPSHPMSINGARPPYQGHDGRPAPNGQHVFSTSSSQHGQTPSSIQPIRPSTYTTPYGSAPQRSPGSSPYTTQQSNALGRMFSHSPPVSTATHHTPQSQSNVHNGQHVEANQRRPSMTFPSPLTGAPVLNPSPPYERAAPNLPPIGNASARSPQYPNQQPRPSPTANASSFAVQRPTSSTMKPEPDHASALPPAITGISPVKHSPPHASVKPETPATATPHVLPPITALSPSPQQQILSPPVKHAMPSPPVGSSPVPRPSPLSGASSSHPTHQQLATPVKASTPAVAPNTATVLPPITSSSSSFASPAQQSPHHPSPVKPSTTPAVAPPASTLPSIPSSSPLNSHPSLPPPPKQSLPAPSPSLITSPQPQLAPPASAAAAALPPAVPAPVKHDVPASVANGNGNGIGAASVSAVAANSAISLPPNAALTSAGAGESDKAVPSISTSLPPPSSNVQLSSAPAPAAAQAESVKAQQEGGD